jgi:hypothetical protein
MRFADTKPLILISAADYGDGARSMKSLHLIAKVEAAPVAAGEEAEQADTRARDPVLSASEVAATRQHMEDAGSGVSARRQP